MDRQADDLTGADDLTLVQAARSGDRLAFGVLYLRHHAAAWRIACVASRFSPDAEVAVIEGFTRVFSALPAESEEFERGTVTFRPYLLACVRQAALDRARAAGRAEPGNARPSGRRAHRPASPPPPAPLAGLAPDGEVVLSSLEHHVARGALAALPERSRTALWLSSVEAMTPGEVGGILGSDAEVVSALAEGAGADVRAAQAVAQGGHEVRADCRFTVDHLRAYHAGTLDPKKGVLVRSHLDLCPPCRMRLGELADTPATLAAAVPAAPLLGGEVQHHWLTSAAQVRPADRLLPPGLAAAAPARHQVLRHGRDRRNRQVAAVASGVPVAARQAGRTAWRAAPTVALIVAWLGVMLSLPRLMQPETAPGPEGLALPAVQAYLPDYLPGAAKPASTGTTRSGSSLVPGVAGSTELAAQLAAQRAQAGWAGTPGEPTVHLIPTTASPRSRAGSPARTEHRPAPPAPPAGLAEVVPTVPTATPVVPLLVAAGPVPASAPTPAIDEASKAQKDAKPTRKAEPEKDSKASKDRRPRQEAKPDRKSEPDKQPQRFKESQGRKQPVHRGRIVTA
jgi:DNA-directed RNA polymerase specialized sigma24 family protein